MRLFDGNPSKDSGLKQEEYKICKQQVLENIKAMDQLEVYAVGAIAAIFVFALTQTERLIVVLAISTAFMVVVYGFVRFKALDHVIGVLNDYVEKLEDDSSNSIGWTKYYRGNRSPYMRHSRHLVWYFLGVSIFFLDLYLIACGPFWIPKPG
ncbi:hypothetical protein [Rhodopseudomonas palustris]|uniref:hypothetical protein n=1 Tax=Rhodopseudomonas palustris TaxID=1076 RepID=UPI00064259E6|nr:hypothetical protein [Rhodopseudomonas palustris]